MAETATIGGVRITHPERVIFPESGVTKGDLAAYYEAVGPLLLAWAKDRPISLVRCPEGTAGDCFFQKHGTPGFGDPVRHVDIREKRGEPADYLYVDSLQGILACAQMNTIEFHGWGSRIAKLEQPDRMVFDLDPGEDVGFAEIGRAAIDIRGRLAGAGLESFALLTGGKGVHVVVPLTPRDGWPAVRDFARDFAQDLAEGEPGRFTAALAKAKRQGRIFVDWLRNQRGSTAVLPYSVRVRTGAPVAAPVSWDELGGIGASSRFAVGDRAELRERAKGLSGWGEASQSLPR